MSNLFLVHHGIKGQKWGIRRFQNKDGTLTSAGKRRRKKNDIFEDVKEARILRSNKDDKDLGWDEAGQNYVNKVSKRRLKKIENSPEMKASKNRIKNYISEDNKLAEQYESIWENAFNGKITEDQAYKTADSIKKRRKELRDQMKAESAYIKSMFEG